MQDVSNRLTLCFTLCIIDDDKELKYVEQSVNLRSLCGAKDNIITSHKKTWNPSIKEHEIPVVIQQRK